MYPPRLSLSSGTVVLALASVVACGGPPAGSGDGSASDGESSSGGGTTQAPSTATGEPTGEPTSTGTGGTTDDPTTGGDPPAEPPDLICPGDPSGECEDVADAPLEAGAAVESIVPACMEAWIDTDMNFKFKKGNDELFDCGCDRLCPEDLGYTGPDEGEGDGQLQAVWMAGFGQGRPATGVRGEDQGLVGGGDGLWARGIVLRQGETTVAIVALDVVGWFNGDVQAVRERLADDGLEVDHVVVHSLHNHEGPDTMGLWGEEILESGYDPKYRAQVREAVVSVIAGSIKDLRPVAQIKVGEVDISTYHDNGVANVITDKRDPFVVDEMISAAHLSDGEGATIATLINFGCHPETMADDNLLLTSDFPHALRRTVETGSVWQTAPGKPGLGGPAIYLNGAVGGMMTTLGVTVVNPDGDSHGGGASWEKTDSIGQLLGEMALDAVELGDVVTDARLRVINKRFRAPVVNEGYKLLFTQGIVEREVFDNPRTNVQEIETEMTLIEVGPIQMLSVPGELLPELAIGGYDGSHVNEPGRPVVKPDNPNPPDLRAAPKGPYIKDRMTGTYRWLIGLGNDELGYIVPEYDFELAETMPWFEEPEGDHYEETNSLGPAMDSLVNQHADFLLQWAAR